MFENKDIEGYVKYNYFHIENSKKMERKSVFSSKYVL